MLLLWLFGFGFDVFVWLYRFCCLGFVVWSTCVVLVWYVFGLVDCLLLNDCGVGLRFCLVVLIRY